MSEQDKAAANTGKTLAGTSGVGEGFDKSGAPGKGPPTEISEADAAIMKQKAIAAAQAKGG
jgi:hypothetical protein